MTTRIPRPGERYRHFKNKQYQVVTVAEHSETGERLVIYQALYGDFKIFARPLAMFLEELDEEKYPDATQKERFKRLVEEDQVNIKDTVRKGADETWRPRTFGRPLRARNTETVDGVSPLLMDFFDAETNEEKYNILLEMRDDITDMMINNMAAVLDVIIPEDELDIRYEALKKCLRTKEKYEINRRR